MRFGFSKKKNQSYPKTAKKPVTGISNYVEVPSSPSMKAYERKVKLGLKKPDVGIMTIQEGFSAKDNGGTFGRDENGRIHHANMFGNALTRKNSKVKTVDPKTLLRGIDDVLYPNRMNDDSVIKLHKLGSDD